MDTQNVIQPGTFLKAETINENSSVLRDHLLGRTNVIEDLDRSGAATNRKLLSGMDVHVTLVKNSSGGTLAPGIAVTWASAKVGTEVGAAAGAGVDAAVIVDPYLKSAVPDGAHFLIITYGPTTGVSGGAITANAAIAVGSNGKMVALVDGTGKGKALAAAGGADVKTRAFVDFRAISTYVAPE